MYNNEYREDMYTDKQFNDVYQIIRTNLTYGMINGDDKCTIILGGQPGAGKSTFYGMRDDLVDYIAINGDEYRRFHPNFSEIIRTDPEHYAERTQSFSNQVVETLIEDLGNQGYNLVIEGTLRNPDVPIRTCQELERKGYKTDLVVVACDAEIAWKATLSRAEAQKESGQIVRLVPIDIYNKTVHLIPDNLEVIKNQKCFNSITIINREGNILFDNTMLRNDPIETLKKELNIENWENKYHSFQQEFLRVKIDLLQTQYERNRDENHERS